MAHLGEALAEEGRPKLREAVAELCRHTERLGRQRKELLHRRDLHLIKLGLARQLAGDPTLGGEEGAGCEKGVEGGGVRGGVRRCGEM